MVTAKYAISGGVWGEMYAEQGVNEGTVGLGMGDPEGQDYQHLEVSVEDLRTVLDLLEKERAATGGGQ